MLGTLQGVKDQAVPATAERILLVLQLTSVSFPGAPTISTRDSDQSGGSGFGGGSHGGAAQPADHDRTMQAGSKGNAPLTQKELKGAGGITVTGDALAELDSLQSKQRSIYHSSVRTALLYCIEWQDRKVVNGS